MSIAVEAKSLMGSSPLRRAGAVLMLVTLLARLLGYFREAVIAATFGASREVDIFLTAITFPAMVVTTVYFSIPNAFVPLWTRAARGGVRIGKIVVAILAAAAALTLLFSLAARPLMTLLAAGYSPDSMSRAVSLLRVAAWIVLFGVIEALLRSRLLALKHFGLPALSYVWQGIGVIVAVVGWPEQGARGMVWGLLAGTATSALWGGILLWSAVRIRTATVEPTGGVKDQDTRVWTWIVLILLIDSLAQIFVVVDRILGSYLNSGAIASLNYASLVVGVSTAIVASTLSTAIFPFLSDAHAEQDRARTFEIVDRAVTWAVILSVPVTVWTLAFSGSVISILFERGAFDAGARTLTSHALAACGVGVLPIALAAIWARLFYAAQRWKPILATSLISLSVKTACAVWWVSAWGVVGLALSGSVAQIAAAIFIAWHERHVLKVGLARWGVVACKVLLLVGLPAIPFAWIISRSQGAGSPTHILLAFSGTLSGVLLLVGVGRRWGISEMQTLWKMLTRGRRKAT